MSTIEAIELSRTNGLKHIRELGDRAMALVYGSDPVFDDEKTANELLHGVGGSIAVVSPINPLHSGDAASADHSRLFTHPAATVALIAERFGEAA